MPTIVIGGTDARISVIDNNANGLGTIVGDAHIVKDVSFSSSQNMEKIMALGTRRPVDRVPAAEDNTYSATIDLAYDTDNPSISFADLNLKLFSARGKTNLLVVIKLYERGFADQPDRDDHLIDVLTLHHATISSESISISAQNVETNIPVSGEWRYLTSQNNPEYSDYSGA